MDMRHLSDQQIQEIADGNTARLNPTLLAHYHACDLCRQHVAEYHRLGEILAVDPDVELSSEFSIRVMEKILAGEKNTPVDYRTWILAVLSVVVGLGASISLSRAGFLTDIYSENRSTWLKTFSLTHGFIESLITALNISIPLFLLACGVLLSIFLIDFTVLRYLGMKSRYE